MLLQNRGIYDIVSTYFLVVIVVFVVLGLFYFNFLVTGQEAKIFEGIEPFEKANVVKGLLFESPECFGGAAAKEEVTNIAWQAACSQKLFSIDSPRIQWFKLEEPALYNCDHYSKEFSADDGGEEKCSKKFVFYFTLIDNARNCLGRFVFCF